MASSNKRLLFICGSLAYGRDGVADYTLRLAAELSALGIQPLLISWADSCQSPERRADRLRLPANLPYSAKLAQVRHFLAEQQPDLISLQFVPYAFHPRGLPFNLAAELASIIGSTPVHIFAHELWVMPFMRCGLKDLIIGSLFQRRAVLSTFAALKPKYLHSSIPLYADTLRAAGFECGQLPIFGNILPQPFADRPARTGECHLGFFGNIAPSLDLHALCRQLIDLQKTTGRRITLACAGNIPSRTFERWQSITQKFSSQLAIERYGHLSPRESSYYLHTLDIALSSYSPLLWGKSGAIAAAREHGRPVVLLSPPERPAAPLPTGIFDKLTLELITNPQRLTPFSPLATVASAYANLL